MIASKEAECCALAGTDYRPTPVRRRARRPQLKRDPLGSARPKVTDPADERAQRVGLWRQAHTEINAAKELRRRLVKDLEADEAQRELALLSNLRQEAVLDLALPVQDTLARIFLLEQIISRLETK